MIWSPHFVWVHVGRTGGYSVDRMCRILEAPDLQLDPLGGEWSRWKRHQTIAQREAETGQDLRTGRVTVSNFRRLPHWLLSFAEYKRKHEGLAFTDEELTQGLLRSEMRDLDDGRLDPSRSRVFHADAILTYFDVQAMDVLLRTEHLAADFLALVSRWYTVSGAQRDRIGQVHENGNQYDRDLFSRLSRAQIESMYESCPLWTQVELARYGHLLV